ncbi:hypothetical protein HN51_015515 [Arachis hypogaea]
MAVSFSCMMKTLVFRVMHVMLIVMLVLMATPHSGAACRPLLVRAQWSRELGLLFESLPNGASPGSGGDKTHP